MVAIVDQFLTIMSEQTDEISLSDSMDNQH